MNDLTLGLLAWLAFALAIAVIVGRSIRLADQYVNRTEHCECGCELLDWDAEDAS